MNYSVKNPIMAWAELVTMMQKDQLSIVHDTEGDNASISEDLLREFVEIQQPGQIASSSSATVGEDEMGIDVNLSSDSINENSSSSSDSGIFFG